ncbi:unnamed protein product (mitochondrion) [Plasmodiophora brassicae]|uniref:Uncharacterized protein n=1 Tax=Plasmodiophora brassicae TaxID=37360 RepID=A0A0G4IUY6_PLABS|nr:hypothetical protein PBRA_007181 [Plasmodiophora brassicae]SPQ98619.1 unnamed protein product [Plasmodiophora brassicae]
MGRVPRLALLALDTTVGATAGAVIGAAVRFAIDWGDGLQVMVDAASMHPIVRERLGAPLRASMFWEGTHDDHGAWATIPVSGSRPRARGMIRGRSIKIDGTWHVVELSGQVPGEHALVDLADDGSEYTAKYK